jgi:hypothetical protein
VEETSSWGTKHNMERRIHSYESYQSLGKTGGAIWDMWESDDGSFDSLDALLSTRVRVRCVAVLDP